MNWKYDKLSKQELRKMENAYERIKEQVEHIEWLKDRMYNILNCKFTERKRGL